MDSFGTSQGPRKRYAYSGSLTRLWLKNTRNPKNLCCQRENTPINLWAPVGDFLRHPFIISVNGGPKPAQERVSEHCFLSLGCLGFRFSMESVEGR